jgi:formylglycine-generating enzyme required for sulfatase activity
MNSRPVRLGFLICSSVLLFAPMTSQSRPGNFTTIGSRDGTNGAEPDSVARTRGARHEIRNSLGMEFVHVPAGHFTMGSALDEKGRGDDEEQHEVKITMPFFIGKHEVTRGQFHQFVDATGYRTDAEKDDKGGGGYAAEKKPSFYLTRGSTGAKPALRRPTRILSST